MGFRAKNGEKKAKYFGLFFLSIPDSHLKEFWPKVHTGLQYCGNVSGPKTIFGVILFQFLIFERNFWYLKCSDFDEILHGTST